CALWFVPVFNPDGNDELHSANRATQNGPQPVGKRANSQGLDLNRDFMKAESPEVRALLGLFQRIDPHLFMDLHTTNGSAHGYQLTYAPSLSTSLDPRLDAFVHERFIPAVRETMAKQYGYRVFDYGNFDRTDGGDPKSWTTYDHKPRCVFNYFGLRNRISMLSEAYSYLPFRDRALATRAFVLANLAELVRRKDELLKLCAAADRTLLAGQGKLGHASRLTDPVRGEVLVGKVERGAGRRLLATDVSRPVTMDVRVRFRATEQLAHPRAWAVVGASELVRQTLQLHGVEVVRLIEPIDVKVERFEIAGRSKARMSYQGHRETRLTGRLVAGTARLPAGAWIVPATQRTARVAAVLLEGHSEDSLACWNFFDRVLADDTAGYPVLRVMEVPAWKTERLPADGAVPVHAPYRLIRAQPPAGALRVKVVCVKPGERRGDPDFGRGVRWRGRELLWSAGEQQSSSLVGLLGALGQALKQRQPVVLVPGPRVTNAELLNACSELDKAGVRQILLQREPE
ncbi:MAG: hypothetical protein KDC87_18995, partial [Planctomycetes bacterium]|nr:hypothetical protein [Planctomycetota bacterium]